MRKIASLLGVLMLFSAFAFAQVRTVTGQVKDKKGSPVPFANISIKGTNTGVSADEKGNFRIDAQPGQVLVVSSTGFTPQESTIGTDAVISVIMEEGVKDIQEVVVTALGIQRQKKELGYATTRVSNAEVNKGSAVNIANGLQGKVSGLNVTTVNNGVFEDVKINLRGIRSLTGNNNPLLVIDGVPVDLRFLSSLNPNDVNEVTVLKGASSAALYGPDARNGVILVTTKKGTRADKPVVTLSSSVQMSSISFFPKFQNEFGAGGYGEYTPYENWSWGPAYDGSIKPIGHELPDGSIQEVTYSALKDERKKFFNTGVTFQNGVSLAAKDFFISIQDANIKGIVPDDENRRTGIRVNTSKEYGRFRVGFNVNYIQSNYNIFNDVAMGDYHRSMNVGLNGGLMNLIFNTPAHIPIRSYKDFENNKFADYNGYFNDYGLNPYFAMDNWRQKGKNEDLITNIDLTYKATNWLSFTYRAAATVQNITATATSKGEIPTAYGLSRSFTSIPGSVDERSYRASRISSEITANFTKTFGDFKLSAIAGQYVRQTDTKDNRVGGNNLVVPELFNPGNRTGELTGSSSTSRTRLNSYFGSVGLNYKGWANVEVTGRNDKVSVLSPDNNSYFYPAVNGSLVVSDLVTVLSNSRVISYLKVRGGWNKTGNADVDPYLLSPTYAPASGFPYGSLPGFTAENTTTDPRLKPEFINSTEVGFELGLLRNRINFEATYFYQDNTDQIVSVRVSDATGFKNTRVNAASFVNKGVELDLKLTPLVPFRNGRVDVKVNATYNETEVTSVYQDLKELFIGGFDNFAGNYAIVGNPAFVFKATDYMRDEQGRVIVDAGTGYPVADPNTATFGRTQPQWIVGINPTVNWKNFNFSVLAEYRGGHMAYHGIGSDMAWTGVSAATAANHRERFVFPNSVYEDPSSPGKYIANTDVAIANVNDFYTGVYRDVASNFLTSAASWRIREAAISYEVPAKFLGKQNIIKGLDIAVNARNLFLWVPKSNVYTDPDFSFSTGNSSGVNVSTINPPVRTYGASVNVRF